MILVADIGGTKTHWRVIESKGIRQFQTAGFNPTDQPVKDWTSTILENLNTQSLQPDSIYLYGAGLIQNQSKAEMQSSFEAQYGGVKVEVETDLLGAARSSLGSDAGLVCILGTGASAAFYDGQQITRRIPSLGHLLGDEGSGFAVGKMILQKYFRGHLPETIRTSFEAEYGILTETEVLDRSYQPAGKAYVASFASFVVTHQSNPDIYRLVRNQFQLFFDSFFYDLSELEGLKISFTGSIAFHLSNILQKVARDKQLHVDLITQDPIAGLALYHQEHG